MVGLIDSWWSKDVVLSHTADGAARTHGHVPCAAQHRRGQTILVMDTVRGFGA